MLHSNRNSVGCVVGCGAPKMEVRASARRPSGSGGKGESTKGRGIVGRGTWLWDLPFVGMASAQSSVARVGDVMWRVGTTAVPGLLAGGGCSATAANPLVGILDSSPSTGICRSGPVVCVLSRATSEAKFTLTGSGRKVGDHRTIVVGAACGRNGEASAGICR
jgi:hypothetical protein